jgi:two-component system OmpR family response regulator
MRRVGRRRPSEAAMPTVLVVDDDVHIRDVVTYALEREGMGVLTAADGREALARVEKGGVDLVVLDILMPEIDGLSVCRRLRAAGNLPIILLSSRGEEVDRIVGLEVGADDYVTKPFSPRELAARVKAVLRRAEARSAAAAPAPAACLRHGRLVLDLAGHEARVDDAKVDFTVTEFGIVEALLARPGVVLSRGQLIERVRAADYHITERSIDTHVRRIRAKLRPFGLDPIATVHGLGYKAAPPA